MPLRNYNITLRSGKIVEKKDNFENQIVARVLNVFNDHISSSVHSFTTQSVITEQQRQKLESDDKMQDVQLVRHKLISDVIRRRNLTELRGLSGLGHDRIEHYNREESFLKIQQAKKALLQEKQKKNQELSQAEQQDLEKLAVIELSNNLDELYKDLEPLFAEKIKQDNEVSTDNLIEALNDNNGTIKFTKIGVEGAGGHAYVLHHDKTDNKYYIISSITGQDNDSFAELKQEYWYVVLQERLGGELELITKNQQNYNQGCMFCASYTEALLRQGKKMKDLPNQMNERIEKGMMDVAYLSLRPIYKDDELKESVEDLPEWYYDNDVKLSEEVLEDNIKQNDSGDIAALIDTTSTSPVEGLPQQPLQQEHHQDSTGINDSSVDPLTQKYKEFLDSFSNIDQKELRRLVQQETRSQSKISRLQEKQIQQKVATEAQSGFLTTLLPKTQKKSSPQPLQKEQYEAMYKTNGEYDIEKYKQIHSDERLAYHLQYGEDDGEKKWRDLMNLNTQVKRGRGAP